jgi:hypothetical protein
LKSGATIVATFFGEVIDTNPFVPKKPAHAHVSVHDLSNSGFGYVVSWTGRLPEVAIGQFGVAGIHWMASE